MSDERTIPALDALAECERLTLEIRNEQSHENGASDRDALRTADILDRQTAVLRMVVEMLERIDCPPGVGRSLPAVSVPASRWLQEGNADDAR